MFMCVCVVWTSPYDPILTLTDFLCPGSAWFGLYHFDLLTWPPSVLNFFFNCSSNRLTRSFFFIISLSHSYSSIDVRTIVPSRTVGVFLTRGGELNFSTNFGKNMVYTWGIGDFYLEAYKGLAGESSLLPVRDILGLTMICVVFRYFFN